MLLSTNAQLVLLTTNAARSKKLPCMLAQPCAEAPTPARMSSQPLEREARAYQVGWQAWGCTLAPCGAHGSVSLRTALNTAALALLHRCFSDLCCAGVFVLRRRLPCCSCHLQGQLCLSGWQRAAMG